MADINDLLVGDSDVAELSSLEPSPAKPSPPAVSAPSSSDAPWVAMIDRLGKYKPLPAALDHFLRHDVAQLGRGASVSMEVARGACDAHAAEQEASGTHSNIMSSIFDEARLRCVGPMHFVLSVFGTEQATNEKRFKGADEIEDKLLSNFGLGYYRPVQPTTLNGSLRGGRDIGSVAAKGGGRNGSGGGDGSGGESATGNGKASEQRDDRVDSRELPEFFKEGVRIEHFTIIPGCACFDVCFWALARTPLSPALHVIVQQPCLSSSRSPNPLCSFWQEPRRCEQLDGWIRRFASERRQLAARLRQRGPAGDAARAVAQRLRRQAPEAGTRWDWGDCVWQGCARMCDAGRLAQGQPE